jgi:hypothetical protein
VNIDKVRLADGEKVLLSATKGGKGGGHTGAMVGAMVATSLIVWPAAPFFLLMHGKDITIPKGTKLTAFVMGDVTLDPVKFASNALAPKAVPAPAPNTASAPAVQTVNTPEAVQPSMTSVDAPQQSLGAAARQYREKKAREQTADQNTPALSPQP